MNFFYKTFLVSVFFCGCAEDFSRNHEIDSFSSHDELKGKINSSVTIRGSFFVISDVKGGFILKTELVSFEVKPTAPDVFWRLVTLSKENDIPPIIIVKGQLQFEEKKPSGPIGLIPYPQITTGPGQYISEKYIIQDAVLLDIKSNLQANQSDEDATCQNTKH